MWVSNTFTSFPDQESVNKSLDELYQQIVDGNTKKGRLVNVVPSPKFHVLVCARPVMEAFKLSS